MRFYIATGLERAREHAEVRQLLESTLGHQITHDWGLHGSVQKEGLKRIEEVAVLEYKGVEAADYVVVLLPGGRGTHTELGIALACVKPVIIHAFVEDDCLFGDDYRTCAFYHHPRVTLVVGAFDLIPPVAALLPGRLPRRIGC